MSPKGEWRPEERSKSLARVRQRVCGTDLACTDRKSAQAASRKPNGLGIELCEVAKRQARSFDLAMVVRKSSRCKRAKGRFESPVPGRKD
jgi:hypothetical protein